MRGGPLYGRRVATRYTVFDIESRLPYISIMLKRAISHAKKENQNLHHSCKCLLCIRNKLDWPSVYGVSETSRTLPSINLLRIITRASRHLKRRILYNNDISTSSATSNPLQSIQTLRLYQSSQPKLSLTPEMASTTVRPRPVSTQPPKPNHHS